MKNHENSKIAIVGHAPAKAGSVDQTRIAGLGVQDGRYGLSSIQPSESTDSMSSSTGISDFFGSALAGGIDAKLLEALEGPSGRQHPENSFAL